MARFTVAVVGTSVVAATLALACTSGATGRTGGKGSASSAGTTDPAQGEQPSPPAQPPTSGAEPVAELVPGSDEDFVASSEPALITGGNACTSDGCPPAASPPAFLPPDAGSTIVAYDRLTPLRLYVLTPEALSVYDATSTLAPALLGFAPLDATPRAMGRDGAVVAVLGAEAGLSLIDLTEPSQAVIRTAGPVRAGARCVALAGTLAAVGGDAGLELLDVGGPAPKPLAFVASARAVLGVALRDGVVYVAAGANGLFALDVADPARPRVLAAYNSPGEAAGVHATADRVYLADGSRGVVILAARTLTLEGALAFKLSAEGVAVRATPEGESLDVYAPNGRLFSGRLTDGAAVERLVEE